MKKCFEFDCNKLYCKFFNNNYYERFNYKLLYLTLRNYPYMTIIFWLLQILGLSDPGEYAAIRLASYINFVL